MRSLLVLLTAIAVALAGCASDPDATGTPATTTGASPTPAQAAVTPAPSAPASTPTPVATPPATPPASPAATPAPTPAPTAPASPAPATPTPPASSPPPATPAQQSVEIRSFVFSPGSISVPVGATIRWTNFDTAPHSATGDGSSFDTGVLDQNESGTATFGTAGTFGYFCKVHPSMRGTVTVTA